MYRLLNFLLFACHAGFSQNLDIKWSAKTATKGEYRFIGINNGTLFAAQNKDNKTVHFRSYGPSLELKNETTREFGNNADPATYLLSSLSDSQAIYYKSLFLKKEDQIQLSAVKSDYAFQQSSGYTISSTKAGRNSFVAGFYSEDRSKVLLCNFYFRRVKSKGMIDREFVVISSTTGEKQYGGTCTYDFSEEGAGDIQVDNEGNAYFVTTEYYREGSKLLGKGKTREKLRIFSKDGGVKEYSFEFSGKYTPGLDIIQGKGNTIYFTGFSYDSDTKASQLSESELFLMRFNNSQLLVTDTAYVTVNGLFPDTRLKKDDMIPYTIRNIYEKGNGGLVLVAEQYQLTTGQYGNTEKYNDIACIQLAKDFSVESVARIPKLQQGFNNPSIVSTYLNDQLYLLYSDYAENLDATTEKIQAPANDNDKNGLFLLTVEPGGQYKKKLVYSYGAANPIPRIRFSYVVDERTVFLSGEDQVGLLKIGQ